MGALEDLIKIHSKNRGGPSNRLICCFLCIVLYLRLYSTNIFVSGISRL